MYHYTFCFTYRMYVQTQCQCRNAYFSLRDLSEAIKMIYMICLYKTTLFTEEKK